MSTFEMLNHQLRHMLGGIEPEKNTSIAELENFQKRIVKAMEKAQNCHKKIYQGAAIVKTNLNELSENYTALFKESKYAGTLIGKVHSQVNKFLQGICEESLSLSKKMEGKVQNYMPNLKKIKEKYSESAETFEHYRQKLQLLKKNVQKQSLANISQDEHQRFERNKDKYRNAEKEHDEILMKITKRFYQFNSEGLRDIFYDFISVISTIGGNICGISHRLKMNLAEHTNTKDLTLAKHLKYNTKMTSSYGQSTDEKVELLNCLIQERQISNFIKSMMEKQINKIEVSQKIQNVFNKKQAFGKENNVNCFYQFQNNYNSLHLRHQQHHSAIDQLKQPDPVQVCQDLLEAEQLSQMSRGKSGGSNLSNDLSLSFQQSIIEHKRSQQNEQKIKHNLQKFNQICAQNKLNSPTLKNINPFANNNMQCKVVSPKEQKTVDVHQFFNFGDKSKKEQKLFKPQEQLVKMHEHLFNFDILVPNSQQNLQKKPTTNAISHYSSSVNMRNVTSNPINNFTSQNKNFEAFDFFGQQIAKSNKNTSKTPTKMSQIKSSELLPRSHKPVTNNFDLLNF